MLVYVCPALEKSEEFRASPHYTPGVSFANSFYRKYPKWVKKEKNRRFFQILACFLVKIGGGIDKKYFCENEFLPDAFFCFIELGTTFQTLFFERLRFYSLARVGYTFPICNQKIIRMFGILC